MFSIPSFKDFIEYHKIKYEIIKSGAYKGARPEQVCNDLLSGRRTRREGPQCLTSRKARTNC